MNRYTFKVNGKVISLEATDYDEARVLLVIYLMQDGIIDRHVGIDPL